LDSRICYFYNVDHLHCCSTKAIHATIKQETGTQMPEGLQPLVIQARFMRCAVRTAPWAIRCVLSPKSNAIANLYIYSEGSTTGNMRFNSWYNFKCIIPSVNAMSYIYIYIYKCVMIMDQDNIRKRLPARDPKCLFSFNSMSDI
jgi:uncharacterized membrane protein YhdT